MTTNRDYRTEFQTFVDARLPKGDFVLAVFAAELVEEMLKKNPDVLFGWLEENATLFVTQYLGDQQRADRNRHAVEAPRAAFKSAADRFTAGDKKALDEIRTFDKRFVVNEKMLRRRLGDMTSADHYYVAGEHTKREASARFEAAFHRVVAKLIPDGQTTSEVMTEQEFERLRDSIRTPKRTTRKPRAA